MAEWEGGGFATSTEYTEIEVPSRSGKSIKLSYASEKPTLRERLANLVGPDPDKTSREDMVIIDDEQGTSNDQRTLD